MAETSLDNATLEREIKDKEQELKRMAEKLATLTNEYYDVGPVY